MLHMHPTGFGPHENQKGPVISGELPALRSFRGHMGNWTFFSGTWL